MKATRWIAAIGLALGITATCLMASPYDHIQWLHTACDILIKVLAGLGLTAPVSLLGARLPGDNNEPPKLRMPPGSSAKALLPLLLLPALLMSGCAFGRCELGKLSSAGQIALATAQDIVSNPDSTEVELTKAAFAFMPGQLECASQALLDWLLKKQARKEGLAFGAMIADPDQHKIAVLRAYLAGKPSACADPLQLRERPHRAAVALLEPCEDDDTCRQIVIDDDVPERVRR